MTCFWKRVAGVTLFVLALGANGCASYATQIKNCAPEATKERCDQAYRVCESIVSRTYSGITWNAQTHNDYVARCIAEKSAGNEPIKEFDQ